MCALVGFEGITRCCARVLGATLKTEINAPPLLLFRGPLGQLQDLQEHLQDIATILGHILAPFWHHLGVV